MLLNELVLYSRYIEKLSGKTVIVISISNRGRNTALQVRAQYYNSISGKFEVVDVVDQQLDPFDLPFAPSVYTK